MSGFFKKVIGRDKKDGISRAVPPAPAQQTPMGGKGSFRIKGDELTQKGDHNGAVVMYNAAFEDAPSDVALYLSRSLAYMLSSPPLLDLALKDADSAIQINPSNWSGWQQKGEILRQMEDYRGACEALTNAVQFAEGLDRFTAQRSLADARDRQSQLSPAVDLPLSSTTSSPQATSPVSPLLHTPMPTPSSSTPGTNHSAANKATSTFPLPLRTTTSTAPTPIISDSTALPSTAPTRRPTSPPAQTQASSSTGLSTNVTSQPIPPTPPAALSSHIPPTTNAVQTITNQSPISRPHNFTNVNQVPASSLPLSSEDLINLMNTHTEDPPSYTPSHDHPDPTIRTLSQQELGTRLAQLQTFLAITNKGSLSVWPYTAAGNIDAIQLLYVGMIQSELTTRELGTSVYLHPSFRTIAVDLLNYPGNTFLDMDCESSGFYDGKIPGTVSIFGYSEEYREHQLLITPRLNFTLEQTTDLPAIPIDRIVEHVRKLQQQPKFEDNEGLGRFMGLSQLATLQLGFHNGGTRQKQIVSLCMAISCNLYATPTRFIDFSKARNFSNNTLGTATQGIGLANFLYQIVLGAELLIRLKKEPTTTTYTGIMTDNVSALIVLSSLWMQHVTIQGPRVTTATNSLAPEQRYTIYAEKHQNQAEGLIRFGEALSWPYMSEARQYIESAYQSLVSGTGTVSLDICDWLFGLILPGKIFRHRVMCCLVYASPSIRSYNPAPYWDNGIVVGNKSYWPKRTVLGRVLGGLRNLNCVCGWIGPLPAPTGGEYAGWIRLKTRRVNVPVPAHETEMSLKSLGFEEPSEIDTTDSILSSITDPSEWIQPNPPTIQALSAPRRSQFKGIHLEKIPAAIAFGSNLAAHLPREEYKASLDFDINDTSMRYTLYSNPIFVAAPPCVGTHAMHRRRAQKLLSSVIKVGDLRESYPTSEQLVIIDALGEGEEVVARAWCAERARHAVVRRGNDCCFTCAIAVAEKQRGLGVNVLIWS